jgi:hypothetical protein
MAANLTTSAPPALGPARARPRHHHRPLRPRTVLLLALLIVAAVVALAPERVADAAHAACTAGNPEHVSCGEALVLLGYP